MSNQELKVGRTIRIRDSLRFRLSASIGIAIMITLFLSSSLLSWIAFDNDIKSEIVRLKGVTTVLATAIASDMDADNRHGVQNGLTSIRAFENLEYAAVVKPNGDRYTEMGVSSFLLKPNIDLRKQSSFTLLFQDKIWVDTQIVKGGNNIGRLEILSNISHLRATFFKSLIINLTVAISTVIVAILFSLRSVKRIIKPVSQLTQVMQRAGRSGIFSDRVEINDHGEVGVLATSFNTMLSQIETRDGQLSDYRVNLENKVEDRTVQLKIAVEQAEMANAAKSDFLATMSHEIRTPMNGMMVMAEMLAAAPLNARHRRYANVISRSGAGLLGIINDILDFSKIEAGQLELEETRVDIDNLVGDVANLFWDKANEKSLELVTQVGCDVPVAMIGDPTRIGQIITNLVNNALKFTAEGGVLVKVLNLGAESGKHRLRFEVTDTGIGIATEKQAAVFERFSQADQSTTRNYGGTGLGLSICQKLVETMGGEIGLESVPGEGSTFWFEVELGVEEAVDAVVEHRDSIMIDLICDRQLLADSLKTMFEERGVGVRAHSVSAPGNWNANSIVVADARWIDQRKSELEKSTVIAITAIGDTMSDRLVEHETVVDLLRLPSARREIDALCTRIFSSNYLGIDALESGSEVVQTFSDLTGTTILAVDDNAVNREVLRDALGVLNVEVTLAESGEEAIEILDRQTFDMVFMDCSMPGIDGFEATQIIRTKEMENKSGRIPIVALTAHVTGSDAEKWRESGMDGYLAKPFTIEGLSSQIADACKTAPVSVSEIEETDKSQSEDNEEIANETPGVSTDTEEIVLINEQTLNFISSLGKSSSINMAAKIFNLYIDHAPTGAANVLAAGGGDNFTELSKLAHALKSMSLSAGAKAVGDLCQIIEDDAKAERDGDRAQNMKQLETLFNQTIEAMNSRIADSETASVDEDAKQSQNLVENRL